MTGTPSASSFSCCPDRQERRSGRSQRVFRKTGCSAKRAYWPVNTPVPARVRTTTLGPFGEVIRATGPMAKVNPFRFSTKYQDDETDIVMYPGRPYNPSTGRFLCKDPIGEKGGLNTYCFVGNNPISRYDALGLWGSDVHYRRTMQWAGELGIESMYANNIGAADDGIDSQYDPTVMNDANWSWHFNRSRSGDSRLTHRDDEVAKAKRECTNPTDNAPNAAAYLGRALHPLQDWVAHADFNRAIEEPSLSGFGWWEKEFYWHNFDALVYTGGLYGPTDPDNPEMDANGPDGRATIDTLSAGHLFSNGDRAYWTGFHGGHQRINLTERKTKELLSDFQSYVKTYGKPCGQCQKAFLGAK